MIPTLNLAFPEKSDIKFDIYNFPDGHVHIKLHDGFNRFQQANIICRVNNANDLFILQQVKSIFDWHAISICKLTILYLFTARCDRHFSIGEAIDIKLIGEQLKLLGAKEVEIYDLHSDKLKECLSYKDLYAINKFKYQSYRICFPDKGANERLNFPQKGVVLGFMAHRPETIYSYCKKYKPIICSKTRISRDKLEVEIVEKPRRAHKRPILVVDDLCDGGGTFIAVAEKLRELHPPKLSLFVTHAVSYEGLLKVSAYYDEVFITNSYASWDGRTLPDNTIQIEL